MTQYKDIPQPTDNRNQSQVDLLNNFRYLTNVSASPAVTGVLPVDHRITGNDTLNPSDGFHNQVSFLNRSAPASLTNAINGQASNAILYTINDGAGLSQLHFYNGTNDFQITPFLALRASVNFSTTAINGAQTINGTAFNVTSVVRSTSGGVAIYTINFTTALPSANYLFSVSGSTSSLPGTLFGGPYTTAGITTTSFQAAFFNANSAQDPTKASVMIFGG